METRVLLKVPEKSLYRRGQLITALARWTSVGLALAALALLWSSASTRALPALLLGVGYVAFALTAAAWQRRRPERRDLKAGHDVVDALAVGAGASLSGGLHSPVWLLLYPHVVAVSVRGGLVYAMVLGVLDAAIVSFLALRTPEEPFGALHAVSILFCAFMGGTTSSYLHRVQGRLQDANRELQAKNQELSETLLARETIRREQESSMGRLRDMEKDLHIHAERLAALNEIASAVNLSLTIEDIFDVAAEQAARLVPFDRLTIALLDDEGPGLEVVSVGAEGQRLRAAFGREQVAWALRRPATWCDGQGEPPPTRLADLLAEPGILSLASVPLFSKDRVIGSIHLGRLRNVPFSAWDMAVLEPVARHIAIALDNARLIEAAQKRSSEFESLLDIVRGIVERLEPPDLLPLVTRSVNRVMGTRHCVLLLKSGDHLELAAQEGLEPAVVESLALLRVGESLSGWVAREGRPLALVDLRSDSRLRFRELVEAYGYCSYLCVPLLRGTEILGTLEVVTKEPRVFGPAQQELMSAFADQAAVAIDNARLFQEARAHLATVKEANRRLEELDQLRQQYLRNVSHEFRTPLTVIKGYAEYLMQSDAPEPRALHDMMRIMVESCDRVIDMVDTLIEVSRIEQGAAERTLQVQTHDLGEIVCSSVDPLRNSAQKKGISVALELPGEPMPIEGDGGLLYQVVRKLVDNALKYSPSGGRVVVRGRLDGDVGTLEVEDAGIGIAPEHLSRIFEKFYMVDGGLTRRVGGSGVGLYLVREIVRLHRGTVDVRSRPGEGSVFSVRLPRQFQRARPEAAHA
jgi:signal transduction histidine kinase